MPVIAAILLILLSVLTANAASSHYIRPGGAGDGSTWANALPAIPTLGLVRGDTYYVASGTYSGKTVFNTAADGTKYIYIKKATSTDHGADAGWSSSYGTGQAIWSHTVSGVTATGNMVSISSNYWDIDGVTGGGEGSWDSGHGFKLTTDNESEALVYISAVAPTGFRWKHTEFAHVGRDFNDRTNANAQGIYFASTDGGGEHYWAYNYFHDNPTGIFLCTRPGSIIFEQNIMDTNASFLRNATNQGAGFTSYGLQDSIIRNNVFKDIEGSAIIALYSWHGQVSGGIAVNPVDNVQIYGNLFYWKQYYDPDFFLQNGFIAGDGCSTGDGNPCDGTFPTYSNISIYNNTFANLMAYKFLYIDSDLAGTNIDVKNNVFFLTQGVAQSGSADTSFKSTTPYYTWFGGSADYRTNLISGSAGNSEFELWTADDLDGWTEVDCDTAANAWGSSPSYGVNGSTACQVTTSAANGYIHNVATTVQNTWYVLRVGYANTSGDTAKIWIYDATNAAMISAADGIELPDSGVTTVSFVTPFKTPAGCVSTQIRLGAKGNGDVVYFDRVSVRTTVDSILGTFEDNEQLWTDGNSPFVDWENGDFRLLAELNAGYNVGTAYMPDAYGHNRNIMGTYSRGAYQYYDSTLWEGTSKQATTGSKPMRGL